jgi:hypothetical protein
MKTNGALRTRIAGRKNSEESGEAKNARINIVKSFRILRTLTKNIKFF